MAKTSKKRRKAVMDDSTQRRAALVRLIEKVGDSTGRDRKAVITQIAKVLDRRVNTVYHWISEPNVHGHERKEKTEPLDVLEDEFARDVDKLVGKWVERTRQEHSKVYARLRTIAVKRLLGRSSASMVRTITPENLDILREHFQQYLR